MKKLISIVIPVYNEEIVLDELVKRLRQVMLQSSNYDFEVIIIENGSRDSSLEKLIKVNKEDKRFVIVQLSRNFGCDAALIGGLKYAKGDAAILMNADLQDPPEIIPQFIKEWNDGYEIVYGVIKKREGVAVTKKIFSSLFYQIISKITGGLFPKNVSDFRLIDKKVYSAVNEMKERNCFLRGMVIWTGFKQKGIYFNRPARFAGKSKVNFLGLIKIAVNGIVSFSYIPLRLATLIGIGMSFISACLIVVFIVLYFIYGRTVPGHTSTIILMLFLFGILFFLLGIIGEYLAKIYDEAKKRPRYIVQRTYGIDSN